MAQAQTLTPRMLAADNQLFAGTSGISQENRCFGFLPGFLDQETGSVYLSRRVDGTPASFHALDGLPEHLILARNSVGQVMAIKPGVIAGFIRRGLFYTREQASRCLE